jgi:hypothetical protein
MRASRRSTSRSSSRRSRLLRWTFSSSTWSAVVKVLAAPIAVAVLSTVLVNWLTGGHDSEPTPSPTRTQVVNAGPASVQVSSGARTDVSGSKVSGDKAAGATNSFRPGWAKDAFTVKNDYLSVTASMNPRPACIDGGTSWIVPTSVPILEPISYGGDADAWAVRNHAVPLSGNKISLTIQGLHGHTVIITRFGVQVTSRRPAIIGSIAKFYAECGGVTHSYFAANLDERTRDISATPVRGGAVAPVVPLPHSVTESAPEQWFLSLRTRTCHCSYIPYFDYTSDGVTARFEIKLGAGPWEVSAPGAGSVPAYQTGSDGRHWSAGK